MPTWVKYLLFQIPGWVITAGVLIAFWHWKFFPLWLAVLFFCAWVLKDLVLYPLCRSAYETGVKMGTQALIGTRGVATGDLIPEGYVRIRGELWRAVTHPPGEVIASGTEVEILSAEGMKVFVHAVNNSVKT